MNVPVDEAQFISIVLKIMNAKKTIEIGVFTGYSLLATALALPHDGKITAIDVDRDAYEIGLPFIKKARMDHKIDFILGDALSVLDNLINDEQKESFDYAFVDADKEEYIKYHELLLKLVKKGGIIAYDNTLWQGSVAMLEENVKDDNLKKKRKPLIEFNNFIANDSRIESTLVSIGDGDLSTRKNILKSSALLKYIFETSGYPKEHEQLKQLRETTVQKYGNKSVMNVAVDEAQFISILLKIMNAKKTLEIGVFTGYSLLSTALALPPDGKTGKNVIEEEISHIIAIDVDREAYETGLPFIQKAGVDHKIEFIQSDALSALHHLIDGKHEESFDYVFVDADKKNFTKYHELLLKLVKKGGIIAYDNTLWQGTVAMSEDENDKIGDRIWQNRKPTLEFNTYIANDTRIESIILSIGDGVTLCRCI
ncbi:Flavonoid 3',5'-methyltransferase, partial [Mucuna pruriens]